MARRKKRATDAVGRRYEVKAELGNFTLARAKSALTLQIYARKEKLGELQVGRGSLYWWSAHKQKTRRVSWARFAEMMDELTEGKRG